MSFVHLHTHSAYSLLDGLSSPAQLVKRAVELQMPALALGAAVSAMAALTFTYPGMPLIYSGQEVGNTKRLAFFEKDLIPGLTVANSITAFYTKLVSLKTKNAALWNNSTAKLVSISGNNDSFIAYSRASGTNKVLTVINASDTTQKVTIDLTKLIAQTTATYSKKLLRLINRYLQQYFSRFT